MEEIARTFGINGKLLLIQAANFGLVLIVLWYFLYRPVMRIVDERRRKIAQGVKDAETAGVRLAEVERNKAEALTKAAREAEELVALGKKRAESEEKRLLAEAEGKSERLLSDAGKRAQDERERVMKESRDEISRLAVLAAEKIIKERAK